jgi:parvulin-like peptidyl-prolyl isomerase
LRLALSAVYRDEGRKDAALTELLEAGRIWPKDGDVQNALGVMLLDAGRTQEAATAFEAALQTRAKDPDALFNLARVRLAQGDPQQAGVLLERLLAAKPDYPGAAQMLEQAREQAPAGLELRLLRVDSRERAEEALRRIAAGTDFAELAREWSNDPTAQAGGDLGAVRIEDLAEPLRAAAARLAVGELSAPVQTPGGWVLLKRER